MKSYSCHKGLFFFIPFLMTLLLLSTQVWAKIRLDDLETKAAEVLIKVSRARGVPRDQEMLTKASEKLEAPHYYEMKSYCMDRMIDMLGLSDDQAREIVTIYDNVMQDFKGITSASPSLFGPQTAYPKNSPRSINMFDPNQVRKVALESEQKVKSLLTPEQRAQFPAFKRYRRRVVLMAYSEKTARKISMDEGGLDVDKQSKIKDIYLNQLEKSSSENMSTSPNDIPGTLSETQTNALTDSVENEVGDQNKVFKRRLSEQEKAIRKKQRRSMFHSIQSDPSGFMYFLIY